MSDDTHFLEQVRNSIRTANMALEEAISYAELIKDKKLKAEAEKIIDSHEDASYGDAS